MQPNILNQLINFFWTILCCAPLVWYWYTAGWDRWASVFLAVSFVTGLLPAGSSGGRPSPAPAKASSN